jgi:hypothetical protein
MVFIEPMDFHGFKIHGSDLPNASFFKSIDLKSIEVFLTHRTHPKSSRRCLEDVWFCLEIWYNLVVTVPYICMVLQPNCIIILGKTTYLLWVQRHRHGDLASFPHSIVRTDVLGFLYFFMGGMFWLSIVRLFCYICIFYHLYVDSLTYAFDWSAFLCRSRFLTPLL